MTLNDFVLKLLVEPGARAEFELDPEGVLAEAGLSDITAADVQEVIPLVVDYAPIEGIHGLVDADVLLSGAVDTDPTSAVSQLQGITQHLPLSGAHSHGPDLTIGTVAAAGVSLNLGELAVAPVTLPGLDVAPVGSTVTGLTGGLGLSTDGDPASTIDGIDSPVGGLTEPVLGGTGPVHAGTPGVSGLPGTIDGITDPVQGVVGGVTDPLGGVVDPAATGVFGLADVTVGTVGDLDPVAGVVSSSDVGLAGTGVGAHTADVVGIDPFAATPTAATHTGPLSPDLGSGPVGGLVGGATDVADSHNGGITDILY